MEPPSLFQLRRVRPRHPRLEPQGARRAYVTIALVLINVLVFGLEEAWGGSESIPTLVRMGAVYAHDSPLFRWPSVIAYGYLHIGPLHLGMNMFALWSLGRSLEPLLGSSRFFVLYTLSLAGGGVAILFAPTPSVTAGASGALFGLLGAVGALLGRRYRNSQFDDERRAIRGVLGRLLLPNLLISLLPGVSLLAHAGGLTLGALFAAGVFARHAPPQPMQTIGRSRWIDTAALLLAALTLVSIGLVWWEFQPWRPVQG